MTIGDVLAAIAAVFAVGATWAAAVLLTALAFPARTQAAKETITRSPGACLGRGLGIAALGAIAAGMLSHSPAGPGKLLAIAVCVALAALTAVGSAGIVRLLGERIQETGTALPPFASLTRAAVLYVAAGFLPGIGWFLVVPVALLLSLGSGIAVLRQARPDAVRPPHASLEGAEATA